MNGLIKLLWVIILAGACQNDDRYDVPQNDRPVLVEFSVGTSDVADTSESSADADARITSIYILQFNATGESYGTLRYVAQGVTTSGGKYTATLLQSVGTDDNYKLVILANLSDYGFLYGLYGKTYDEVQQACLSVESTSPLAFDYANPFPMFGVVNGGSSVQVRENTLYNSNTELIRGVARVDLGIGKKITATDGSVTWNKNNVPFNMTEIQIWKAGKRYAYMPASGNFHWNTVTGGSVTSNHIVVDTPSVVSGETTTMTYGSTHITNGTYCSGQIYLSEADLRWGSIYDANHTNRLAIIVGGKYNGSQTETFYRVDFTNDRSGVKMDILRNHVYQFTIGNVADEGYATAELAYNSKPKNIKFTAELVPWTATEPVSVPSIVGYQIAWGRLNGENLSWNAAAGLNIPKKKGYWGDNLYLTFNYNEFYGEANSFYAPIIPVGAQNGKLYATVQEAFNLEGAYPALMVSSDDVTEIGGETVAWKTGITLTAFDICRGYQGDGFHDWRLPRLSELALIYLNKHKLENMRGFTTLSGTYWSGSEYLVSNSDADRKHSERAWGINFDAVNPSNATDYAKTEKLKIRCVRQVQ